MSSVGSRKPNDWGLLSQKSYIHLLWLFQYFDHCLLPIDHWYISIDCRTTLDLYWNEHSDTFLFSLFQIEVDGKLEDLEIFATAGQEEFSPMQDDYYRSGDGFLLVFSITRRLSYNNLKDTYNKRITARQAVDEDGIFIVHSSYIQITNQRNHYIATAPSPPLVLAGNKCDLSHEREVETSLGKKLGMQSIHRNMSRCDFAIQKRSCLWTLCLYIAKEWRCPFFETSAKDKTNTMVIFEELVRQIRKKEVECDTGMPDGENDCCRILWVFLIRIRLSPCYVCSNPLYYLSVWVQTEPPCYNRRWC